MIGKLGKISNVEVKGDWNRKRIFLYKIRERALPAKKAYLR